jgi:hypothetical protein
MTVYPQLLLEFIFLLVVAKFGVGLYLVYGVQGDDVGFGGIFLRSHSEIFPLREEQVNGFSRPHDHFGILGFGGALLQGSG